MMTIEEIKLIRLASLVCLGVTGSLIFLIFMEYLRQILDSKRKNVPIDRIGILLSYLGFVILIWVEVYIRFKENAPLHSLTLFSFIFTTIGIISLARKLYRIHFLTDEDKLLEDGGEI